MIRKIKKICIVFTLSFVFFIAYNSCYAAEASDIDVKKIAQDLIQKGVASDVANKFMDNGFLGDKIADYYFDGFATKFAVNGNYQFTLHAIYGDQANDITLKRVYSEADDVNKTLFDIYEKVSYEVKDTGNLDWFFDRASRYSGAWDDEYARSVIGQVVVEVVNQRIEELGNSYKQQCEGHIQSSTQKFKVGTTEYKCSDMYYTYNMFGEEIGTETFYKNFGEVMKVAAENSTNLFGSYVNDTTQGHVEENQYYKGKKKKTGGSSSGTVVITNKDGTKYEIYGNLTPASYMPSLMNAIKFANQSMNVEKLDFAKSTGADSTIMGIVVQMTTEFANYGVYILYAIILFLGVKMIWSGVNGRVQFAETLPYLAVGIIFFYAAPGLVKAIQEVFGSEIALENQASTIFGTVAEIVRVLAFSGVIFYGIKLMFSAFDKKVELKKSFIAIFVGCIIVFAASTVVDFVLDTAKTSGLNTNTNIENLNN